MTTPEIETARELARRAQYNAQINKRRAGDPRNPFRARPGLEAEFAQAEREARAAERILKELEGAAARERALKLWPKKQLVIRTVDRIIDVIIGVGIIALASMGAAAVCYLAGASDPITRAAALIGLGVILARELARAARK